MKLMMRILAAAMFLLACTAFAAVTGSIQGRVTDTTGSVVPGAAVTVTNTGTNISSSTRTNADGSYSFPDLAVGTYDIQIRSPQFSAFRETGIVLNVNAALRIDAALHVGPVSQSVTVQANAVHVQTISTQLGQVIGSTMMTSIPLNGRSYTDLLALQPGVIPQSTQGQYGTNSYSNAPPSGGLDSGALSISGARGSSNGFMVNGGNVMEQMANGTAIIPNIDSIAEFRIITNNFDAEYGHYSGGVVNVITKSGTNQFHGDLFEFLRNTNLDARNYYSPTRGVYHQNQFGGTVGGPILRNRLFFFLDYQGTRQNIGQDTGLVPVPSAADRSGDLSDVADQLTGTVIGPAFANNLSTKLGYPVTVGEPFYMPGCTKGTCVFPNAIIPKSVWSPPSGNILKFIPLPNVAPSANLPTGAYTSSANPATLQDDKAGARVDGTTPLGRLSGYYFIDQYSLTNPFGGSSFAGFGSESSGRAQLITIEDTKSFGSSKVNDLHLSYMRNKSIGSLPTGPNVDLASLGFTVGCDTLGICEQHPQFKTLPQIAFNNFTMGMPSSTEFLTENTFQGQDHFSWIVGNHSLTFGGIVSYAQLNMQTFAASNTVFGFSGSAETGLDFADFLLGTADTFNQGVQFPLYNRSIYYGIFGQDSWRATPTLTVNYGLRWDVSSPWWEKYNRMEALVPGRQSVVFPTAPRGWLVTGDPSIPRTVAPIQYGNLAPRIGFAYSPNAASGFFRKLTGGPGDSSIRASFGIFYSDIQDYINANGNGDAPYGLYWVAPTPATFATPYVDVYTGNPEGQRFPVPVAAADATPSKPDASLDWSQFLPISSSPTYYYGNVTPYAESWMLSIERQLARSTVLTVSYVGKLGRHNMVSLEANPSNPATCLSVSQPSEVAPGSNVCGPFSETGSFTTASGQTVVPRQLGVNFGSTGWYRTMGSSAYNALEASLKYSRGRSDILASYTFSKSMDDSSSAAEQVMPFDPGLEWALSTFNIAHNFVFSYSYNLPFDMLFGHNRFANGWVLSGITRLTTGFPVTITENDDADLIGNTSLGSGIPLGEPNFTPGKLLSQTNPRKGGTYFNTALFSLDNLGQFGNAKRRFFSGPGTDNWDMALEKTIPLSESRSVELRAEFFNVFNHAQFNNPSGLINGGAFGVVTSAQDPRIGQVAAKFRF